MFSKDYASSEWCLDELVKILERRQSVRHIVFPVFYDVAPSQVRDQSGSFGQAFSRHEEVFEWKGKLEGWREALREVANLGGLVLENETNGHEATFIQKIVKEIGKKLKRAALSVALFTIGVEPRVRDIDLWLKDGSTDVGVGVICGMGGIGKTTIAKVAYNMNFDGFEASSFIANVRGTSEHPNGLVRLQKQLLSDISKGKTGKIYNVDEGIVKIQDAICRKRILVVLDDVDRVEHLDAVIGARDAFFSGSKIIITTRHERLLKTHEEHKTFRIKELNHVESFQLFCWHAFGLDHPIEGYVEHSERVIQHCEGLPLALQVLGSSLSGRNMEVWESALEKLEVIPDVKIQRTLEISYKSLQDDHDKNLFLNIASSFVGMDKDNAAKMLEESNFYSTVGMQNLMDRSLVTIDSDNKLMMHQLVRDMGREIIRQESLEEPDKHRRLLHHRNFSDSRRVKTDTQSVDGPLCNKLTLETDTSIRSRAKQTHSEALRDEPMFPPKGSSLKRRFFGIFSLVTTTTSLIKKIPGQRKYT